MYEYFAFVDESVAKKYRLCIVALPSDQLNFVRSELKKLRLKGQNRIHMHNENSSRRVAILKAILGIDSWKCLILETTVKHSDYVDARERLFILASAHSFFDSIKHLTIEESNEKFRDKKLLTWIRRNTKRTFEFDFERPANDACLWLADALVWAFARGGDTRRLIASRIEVVSSPS